MTTKLRMKRHNQTEASVIPCYFSWSIICFLLVLCFFSCACRNKATSDQLSQVGGSSVSKTEENKSSEVYLASEAVKSQYNEIVKLVKAKEGYSLFGEFLARGKYADILTRIDKFEFMILVPSDAEIKKLDNKTLNQLIYPDIPDQSNLNFLFDHVAFALNEPGAKKEFRTMASKSVVIDGSSKNITIDRRQFPIIDEAKLPPSTRVLFIDNYLN